MPADPLFWLYFAVLLAFLVGAGAFFRVSLDAPRKRRLFVPFIALAMALLLGSVFVIQHPQPLGILFILVPLGVLQSFWVIRVTRFCDGCGLTNRGKNPMTPPEACSKCGTKLH